MLKCVLLLRHNQLCLKGLVDPKITTLSEFMEMSFQTHKTFIFGIQIHRAHQITAAQTCLIDAQEPMRFVIMQTLLGFFLLYLMNSVCTLCMLISVSSEDLY